MADLPHPRQFPDLGQDPLRQLADPDPDHRRMFPVHPMAGYRNVAAGGGEEPGDHADGGGLAGAVGSEQAETLAFRHVEADPVYGRFPIERFPQILNLNHAITPVQSYS